MTAQRRLVSPSRRIRIEGGYYGSSRLRCVALRGYKRDSRAPHQLTFAIRPDRYYARGSSCPQCGRGHKRDPYILPPIPTLCYNAVHNVDSSFSHRPLQHDHALHRTISKPGISKSGKTGADHSLITRTHRPCHLCSRSMCYLSPRLFSTTLPRDMRSPRETDWVPQGLIEPE